VTIRVNLETSHFATVHVRPSWLALWLTAAIEQDFEVWRIPDLGGAPVWVTHDNHAVTRAVANAIASALGWYDEDA
jgi:hypothetical protein